MLNVGNRGDGAMYLYLGRGEDSGGGSWSQNRVDLPVGRWVHVEAYYEKAADRGGRVAVWQDGEQILDVEGVQTANSADLGWAVVSYGEGVAPGEVVVYVDGAAISSPPDLLATIHGARASMGCRRDLGSAVLLQEDRRGSRIW